MFLRVTIVNKDRYGRHSGYITEEAIRQESMQEIDNVWRKYNKKFQAHHGNLMTILSVVMLSKLDPRLIRFLKSSHKNPEDKWWTAVNGGRTSGDADE